MKNNAHIIFASALLVSVGISPLYSQSLETQWTKEKLSDAELNPKNIKNSFKQYDLSKIWSEKQDYILGFIGKNYQRLHIRFISIEKDPTNPLQYIVKGKSKVKSNICDFSGVMTIEEARKYKSKVLKEQAEFFNNDVRNAVQDRSIVVLKCVFDEDKNQKYPGRFEGKMLTKVWIDQNNQIRRDDLSDDSNFKNNQFVGTWTSHNKRRKKPSHWGEYRIPLAHELDQGSSEFFPADQYINNGWKDVATPGHPWWTDNWYQ